MSTPLNQLISQSRKAKGLTQEQLAEQTKLTLRTIQRLENQPSQPRIHTLKTVASVLDLPWERLQPLLLTIDNADPATVEPTPFSEQERRFLQLVNLTSLAGLFLPLLNILLSYRLLRRTNLTDPRTQEYGWQLFYKQIWWTVWTQVAFLLTLCYNITVASFAAPFLLIPYLLPFLVMNGLVGFHIHKTHQLLQKA